MALSNLFLTEITEKFTRENFRKILEEFRSVYLMRNMRLMEFTISGNGTALKYPHKLGFKPLDVIQTYKIGDGVFTWRYELFDDEFVYFNVASLTTATTVRLLLGRLED